MTALIVIRHGETDWNLQQRFQGQIDVPLNEHGLHQAQQLARRLAGEAADAVYSSDLRRARETVAPIAAAWGLDAQELPAWREQGFGVLEGLDLPTIQVRHCALLQRWLEHRADYALPGGESTRDFHDRVWTALRDLVRKHEGQCVAIVTHGGVLDMLWRGAQDLPLDGPRSCEIPNAGINRLHWTGTHLQIECWADDAHLAGLSADAPVRSLLPR